MLGNDERAALLCPVCGQYHFEELNAYEICPVCGWEDDPVQRRLPWYRGGANDISLKEARRRYGAGQKAVSECKEGENHEEV